MENNFWKKIKNPVLALAPMAGFTDSAFRQISKKYGADVVYSEMASVSALYFNSKKTLELLKFRRSEKPYVVQIFGKNPEHFAKATRIISEKVKPDGIDINFGCPVKKIFKEGSGCALMLDEKLARKIIETVLENTELPVSIKIRTGVKNKSGKEFVEYVKDLPFSAIMIHGRTYEAGFSGPIDFEFINWAKKTMPEKIVLANGGINSPEDALDVLEKCPEIDGLGIARGALGKPFIFQQIKDLIRKKKYRKYDFTEIKKIMLEHTQVYFKGKSERKFQFFYKTFDSFAKRSANLIKGKKIAEEVSDWHGGIRKHLFWYAKNFPGASELRRQLVQIKNYQDIKNLLK